MGSDDADDFANIPVDFIGSGVASNGEADCPLGVFQGDAHGFENAGELNRPLWQAAPAEAATPVISSRMWLASAPAKLTLLVLGRQMVRDVR